MTTGLIKEWQRSGRKPKGSVSEWGADAWVDEDDAGRTTKDDL
jgi:hypothetical protein